MHVSKFLSPALALATSSLVNAYANPNAYAMADPYAHADPNALAEAYAKAEAYAEAYAETYANADFHLDDDHVRSGLHARSARAEAAPSSDRRLHARSGPGTVNVLGAFSPTPGIPLEQGHLYGMNRPDDILRHDLPPLGIKSGLKKGLDMLVKPLRLRRARRTKVPKTRQHEQQQAESGPQLQRQSPSESQPNPPQGPPRRGSPEQEEQYEASQRAKRENRKAFYYGPPKRELHPISERGSGRGSAESS